MPGLPAISDRFKSSIINETAERLSSSHGRRRMYSREDVAAAMRAAHFPDAWTGWAVALFCTDREFADHCAAVGIEADYRTAREDALRHLDRPNPPAARTAGAAVGTAEMLESVGEAAEIAVDVADVAGEIFDALGIFS